MSTVKCQETGEGQYCLPFKRKEVEMNATAIREGITSHYSMSGRRFFNQSSVEVAN